MLELAIAVVFVWLGMVLAISFLEAPLKFRAPGVTIPLGLGIGRIVFRALNTCEVVFAVVVAVALLVDDPGTVARVAAGVAVALLVLQLAFVRPLLTKRSDAVLAAASGAAPEGPSSHVHLWYVGLELAKVAALVVAGVCLLR